MFAVVPLSGRSVLAGWACSIASVVHTLYFLRSSFSSGEDIIFLRAVECAWKWAARALRADE